LFDQQLTFFMFPSPCIFLAAIDKGRSEAAIPFFSNRFYSFKQGLAGSPSPHQCFHALLSFLINFFLFFCFSI